MKSLILGQLRGPARASPLATGTHPASSFLNVQQALPLLRLGQGAAGLEALTRGLDDDALPLAAVQSLAVVLGSGAEAFALAAVDAIAAARLLLLGGTGR